MRRRLTLALAACCVLGGAIAFGIVDLTSSPAAAPTTNGPVVAPRPPITTAAEACRYIIGANRGSNMFSKISRVDVVAARNHMGWGVEVWAHRVYWNHSEPAGAGPGGPENEFVAWFHSRNGEDYSVGDCFDCKHLLETTTRPAAFGPDC